MEVSKIANGLKNIGVKKDDRVTIYLTMIPILVHASIVYASSGIIVK